MRSVIDILDLSVEEVDELLATAEDMIARLDLQDIQISGGSACRARTRNSGHVNAKAVAGCRRTCPQIAVKQLNCLPVRALLRRKNVRRA